jgi:hypothetical protein
MILINEWLPNPAGTDSGNEWVELWNGGPKPVNLAGWTLSNPKKSYKFADKTVSPGGFLVLNTKGTGLTLRNQDETLTLKRTDGKVESTSAFTGSASEGRSWAWNGAGYVWAEPSPGKENVWSAVLAADNFPRGAALNSFPWIHAEEAALGAALLIALGVIFLLKRNENQNNPFSGGN